MKRPLGCGSKTGRVQARSLRKSTLGRFVQRRTVLNKGMLKDTC